MNVAIGTIQLTIFFTYMRSISCQYHNCKAYPGYFWAVHWKSMSLPEISRMTWQPCSTDSADVPYHAISSGKCRPFCLGLNVLPLVSTVWLTVSGSLPVLVACLLLFPLRLRRKSLPKDPCANDCVLSGKTWHPRQCFLVEESHQDWK